ncbi:MAG: hypothetical protein WBW61_02560 [Rhodanobacteraceae bacterium]
MRRIGRDSQRAAARRTAMIVGAIAIAIFLLSIAEVVMHKGA